LGKAIPKLSLVHTVVFDFDGVFTDNKVLVDQNGSESVRCDRADGLAMDFVRTFKKQGLLSADFFILSKEFNPVVIARTKKLGLDCHHGISDKLDFMISYFADKKPNNPQPFQGLVYLGNDLNDLPIMRHAGFSVAPSDAHLLVQEVSHLVMKEKGGEGFVRAFIEKLLRINQLSKEKIDELVSDR
jgi:3-deoxy-D-manno-octulosonate 8-phosphate phosphatase (KDO 8-P phosphatase)